METNDKVTRLTKRMSDVGREPIFLTRLDGSTERIIARPHFVKTLLAILELTRGRRLFATTAQDLFMLTHMSSRTISTYLNELIDLGLLARIDLTAFRRIRIEHRPGSGEALYLSDPLLRALEILDEISGGQSTFTLRIRDFNDRFTVTDPQVNKILGHLVDRGVITDIVPSTGRSYLFRLDVKRNAGRGIQLEQLPPETDDDIRNPLLLLAPTKMRTG